MTQGMDWKGDAVFTWILCLRGVYGRTDFILLRGYCDEAIDEIISVITRSAPHKQWIPVLPPG